MLFSKLVDGVIVVEQGRSRRAIRPYLLHRIMLLWVFRYFASLPLLALPKWQKSLIVAVLARGLVVPVPGRESGLIIGTVESAARPAVEEERFTPAGDWDYVRQQASRNRASA